MYEAIIMDYMIYGASTFESKSAYGKQCKFLQTLYNKYLDYSIENNQELADRIVNDPLALEVVKAGEFNLDEVLEETQLLEDVKKYVGIMKDIEKYCKTAKDYLETVFKILALEEANSQRIEFLKRIRANVVNNPAMCEAIDKILFEMENIPATLTIEALEQGADFGVKEVWTALKKEIRFWKVLILLHRLWICYSIQRIFLQIMQKSLHFILSGIMQI